MDQENIMFFENDDKSYTVVDLYINSNRYLKYIDSCNYYDIDVDKILLLKKSDNEYFVRYNDVNKNKIVPLQLKINNFSFGKLDIFAYDNADVTADVDIGSNDKKCFIKCREIWNKIIELMDIDNPSNFVDYYFDENGDDAEGEFIMLDIEKNISAIRDKNRNYLVFIFTSVIANKSLQTSLVQYRY